MNTDSKRIDLAHNLLRWVEIKVPDLAEFHPGVDVWAELKIQLILLASRSRGIWLLLDRPQAWSITHDFADKITIWHHKGLFRNDYSHIVFIPDCTYEVARAIVEGTDFDLGTLWIIPGDHALSQAEINGLIFEQRHRGFRPPRTVMSLLMCEIDGDWIYWMNPHVDDEQIQDLVNAAQQRCQEPFSDQGS